MTATLTRIPTTTTRLDASGQPVGKVRHHGHVTPTETVRPDGLTGTRRPRRNEEAEMVGDIDQAIMVLKSPDFWATAEQFPGNTRQPGTNGRPSDNPAWVLWFLTVITTLKGGQRSAINFVRQGGRVWETLREVGDDHRPPGFDPAPHQVPNRDHLRYFVKKWKRDASKLTREAVISTFRQDALNLAHDLGHLRDDAQFRYDQPDRSQWVAFDGTVYKGPSSKRPKQGKNHRVDPACGWHNSGGKNNRVWGTKVVFASVRSEDYWGRIIVDFEHVEGSRNKTNIGDEAAATVQVATRIKTAARGMRGIIVDGVIRGTHITELSRIDVHTVNRPAAKANPSRKTEGTNNPDRVEKEAKVIVHRHPRRNGTTCTHDLWVIGSVFHEKVLDSAGTKYVFVPVEVSGVERRQNKTGTFRHYQLVTLNCVHGNTTVRIPLHHSAGESGFNRGELLRFYPTNTWQFGYLYGRRNDTESLHNQVKRTMPRLPAYGHIGQELFVLAYAVRNNAVARALALQRQQSPAA